MYIDKSTRLGVRVRVIVNTSLYVFFPMAALHTDTSSVWVRFVSAQVLFLVNLYLSKHIAVAYLYST